MYYLLRKKKKKFHTVNFDLFILCSKAAFSFSNKRSDSFLRLNSVLFLSCNEAISARALTNSCLV